MSETVASEYNASQITVLEGLEAVRRRPAMYIGSTDVHGLHHLVYEVIDNSVDEALAGFCTEIEVSIEADNSIKCIDNGRGIPIDIFKDRGVSAAEVVLTVLHAGGKFEGKGYKISGGLHGVGVSCVNALAEWLKLEIFRNNKRYTQTFRRGVPDGRGKLEEAPDHISGTTVHYLPDKKVFETSDHQYDVLAHRIKELAFLNKGLKIAIEDRRGEEIKREEFQYSGGIMSYVESLNANKEKLFTPPIYILKQKDGMEVEVAMQYCKDYYDEHELSFANNIRTREGGTHVSGFRTALTRAINSYAKKYKLIKGEELMLGTDVREGLVSVVSVKLPNPQFEGQTKSKLGNSEVKGIVDSVVAEGLENFLEREPSVAKHIIEKSIGALRVREAVRKAQDLARRKSVLESTTLPGKLADCSEKDPSKCEIFLVEGDSAGGSAKQGRDRHFQAILPLRGKIINVEKARLDKILANEEIRSLITAIAPEIIAKQIKEGEAELSQQDILQKMRYHKIIIMTDADVDGAHIRTLLLTFFYRYARELLESETLYIAQPPLYLVKKGNTKEYAYNEDQKKEILGKLAMSGVSLTTQVHTEPLVGKAILDYHDPIKQLLHFFEICKKHLYDVTAVRMMLPHVTHEDYVRLKQALTPIAAEVFVPNMIEPVEGEIIPEMPVASVVVSEGPHQELLGQLLREKKVDGLIIKDAIDHYQAIAEERHSPYIIKQDAEEKVYLTLLELSVALDKLESRGGINIQRYKGLGEMNPDQLWETTMDPSTRSLLRVKLTDAEEADEIFTILMGSEVEPRRDFIMKYAKSVRWLDI